jgi:hypothetical protein
MRRARVLLLCLALAALAALATACDTLRHAQDGMPQQQEKQDTGGGGY